MMGHDQDSTDDDSHAQMESLVLHDPPPKSSFNGAFRSPPEISTTAIDDSPAETPTRLNHDNSQSPNSSLNSFLEPPSYADAMFRSFDADVDVAGEINGHERVNLPSSDSEYIYISVSDPQKVPEASNSLVPGSGSYYTYLITTRTNLPEFEGTEFSVRRRFREVVTLSERLAEAFRGYFIPLRPDKSIMESQMMQTNDFVDQRRIAIEKYLKKLAAHPVIRKSDEFKVFLQVEGKLTLARTMDVTSRMLDGMVKLPGQLIGESTIAPEEVVQPAKGGRDLFRLFKELKQAVTNDWGGTKPTIVEEDKEFLGKKEKLNDLEVQLSNVSQQAETLVKAQQDIGETMGELGLAFVKLTKFELEEATYECQRTRAADMKNMATAAVKASRLYRELNSQTVKHLDKLHDYLGMMLAVDNAFTDRSNALLTVQTLVSELSSLESRVEKLEVASSKIFGGDRSRMRKIEELKETMKATEDARCCAVREYERIKENNRSELARLDKERCADFLSMLKGFVVNQAGYAEKVASVWEKVADETKGYETKGYEYSDS
ncbi:sorting nexin 2B [Beta vulgaris subsp. vulgaris]|uniref:sorting nexin 2B n=1 Tax=Beta vulgaris subsp. vulgaris TaxID=3555 RepID=UPI0020368779|nr:sorting nexin 2B [Beta vulgaris subsp. vulgaris]